MSNFTGFLYFVPNILFRVVDYEDPEKGAIKDSILKVLKKMVDLSNSNPLKNADGLLATKPMDQDVQWVGDTRRGVSENFLLFFIIFFNFFSKKISMNYLPVEVWVLIISYLPLNDVIEFSCL